MPFQKTCIEDEAVRFIALWRAGQETMTALCSAFGISRAWGYELVGRYRREGAAGLVARSRAPLRPGQALSGELAGEILALRGQHPYWGPRKLRAWLMERQPMTRWPAASTIGDLLRREGLSRAKRRRRSQRRLALGPPRPRARRPGAFALRGAGPGRARFVAAFGIPAHMQHAPIAGDWLAYNAFDNRGELLEEMR